RMLSDEEIFGSSAPMTGALAPGAYNGQELLPARMVKPAIAGSEISEKADNVQNKRQIQIGGERRDPRLLADVTNAGRNPGLIPFGGPYSMGAPSSSGSPRLENQRPQTIQERRAAKRMAMQK
ncbi:hypothetical protein MMC21_003875, partial [Puttea exsequens]|nr:hypothetical protein [Puttea exsequens]